MKNRIVIFLRGIYNKIVKHKRVPDPPSREMNKDIIMRIISDKIKEGKPFMFARFGSIECDVCENIKYTLHEKRSNWKFICWKGQPNFINPYLVPLFSKNAGFFPSYSVEHLERFYKLMVKCMPEVDVLASWCYNEADFKEELKNAIKVDRETSIPLFTNTPWTLALEGKKVLVVHPFAETIKSQYARIDKVFPKITIMPEFELEVIQAVQTAGGNKTQFKDWFEALEWMKREIDKRDYDVCLLGCGAYGFPLAAHCKRQGKQAIHMGGVLQLLFGIKGRRWESENIYLTKYRYIDYYNKYWVRASKNETPIDAKGIENSCYW